MSDFWPPELVEILAQRRGIIFLGAGASTSCVADDGTRQPTWSSFLTGLAATLSVEDRAAFDTALERSRLLDAAQIAVDGIDVPAFDREVAKQFANHAIKPGPLYESVTLLDQPIVMTTNYDRMYERYWEQMQAEPLDGPGSPLHVSQYTENDVVDALRSNKPVLLKLHGTVEKPRNVVLSRSQYSRARYEHANFFRIVSALILTRTVLFVGCGFNGDPDIDLLLEDTAFTAQSSWPHYAVLASGRHTSERAALRSGFNVKVLEYDNSAGDHSQLQERLKELASLVVDAR